MPSSAESVNPNQKTGAECNEFNLDSTKSRNLFGWITEFKQTQAVEKTNDEHESVDNKILTPSEPCEDDLRWWIERLRKSRRSFL
jgi:hypothetical protein